jgi:DMSO/TMAO reductase YedYZ molybdopterin-dependent catalytic subunit
MSGARMAWLVSLLVICSDRDADSAQDSTPSKAVVLSVGGEVPQPVKLTATELARLPRQSVRGKDRDGKEVEFEGVPLVEVLKTAGVKFGHDLRGPALANYLVVEAADGYRVVFALPELDPASTDRVILLADRRAGKPLDEKEGPLRVIVPGEKRPARWVKQVISLRVGRAEPAATAPK